MTVEPNRPTVIVCIGLMIIMFLVCVLIYTETNRRYSTNETHSWSPFTFGIGQLDMHSKPN